MPISSEAVRPPGDRPQTRLPGPPRHLSSRRQREIRRHRIVAGIGSTLVVLVLLVGVSMVGAVRSPGNSPFTAKWADWLRAHHLSALVTPLENWYYNSKAPAKGGRPKQLNALPGRVVTRPAPATPAAQAPLHLTPPTQVPLVVSPALSGEGVWQPVSATIDGQPAMYEAQFRADTTYTSQITSAVWIDPTLAKVALVPGSVEPGGTWTQPPDLTGAAETAAMAAFNGGFRFQDAHGGFYLDGRTAVPLVAGAASVVIYDSGKIDVGTWGSEVSMTPHVVAVLQNLIPIVDHGAPAPSATYADHAIWGNTVGSSTVVARSGIGVTASGALVYVAGPSLTAKSLAESLQRAGAVRAMSLDINPDWVTFNFFEHPTATTTTGIKLYPQMLRGADRYLGPGAEARDFFTISQPAP